MRWGSRSKRNSIAQEKSNSKNSSSSSTSHSQSRQNGRNSLDVRSSDLESQNNPYAHSNHRYNGSSASIHTARGVASSNNGNNDYDAKNSIASNTDSTANNLSNLTLSGSTTSINSTFQSNSSNQQGNHAGPESIRTLAQNDNESITPTIPNSSSFKLSHSGTSSSLRPFNYETYDSSEIRVGWLNKGQNVNNWTNVNSDSWRLYKAQLKGPVLSLYKIPADLNIKAFDHNSGNPPVNNNLEPASSQQSVRQKRLSTASSRLNLRQQNHQDSKNSPTTPTTPTTLHHQPSTSQLSTKNYRIKLKYLSEVYPHPDLQLNASNSIVSGTLESICHTILFNTLEDDKLSYNLLVILPLFGDMKASLRYFIEYAVVFTSARHAKNAAGRVSISINTDNIITQRLALVINTIKDSFPGMLLDDDLSELVAKLLEIMLSHNEEIARSLRKDVSIKEGEMKSLTFFKNQVYQPNGSLNLTNVDNFLALDSQVLANQINRIDLKFNKLWNPKTDASLLYELENLKYARYNPLIFNSSTNIHYLGRLLTNHLFGDNETKNSEIKRAKILSKWIELGCVFDKIGDMVSWLAIATVICSMPILRLKKTWSLVDEKYLKTISTEWAPVVFELDRRTMISEASHRSSYHVIAPQGIGISYSKYDVVPYFGDLTVKYIENSTLKQCEKRVQRVKVSFSRWDEYLENVDQEDDQFPNSNLNGPNENMDLLRQLYNLLSNHISLPALSQESIMELSLLVEPSIIGQYHTLHYNSRTPLITGSYLPTLFTEVLPSYKLFDQSVLIGASGFASARSDDESDNGSNFQKITGVNDVDLHSYVMNSKIPSSKQHTFLKSVRDIFNIGSDVFHIEDDLIFKSLNNGDEWKSSRPASVVLENPSSKRLSQISNNRLSHISNSNSPSNRVSGSLELTQTQQEANDVFAVLDNSNLLNSLVKPLDVVLKAGTFEKLIDILVLTSNVFSKRIEQEDIDRYLEKSHLLDNQFLKLNMNNGVFTSTFFATYKSFATTTTLLENLAKRFIGSKSGAISISRLNSDNEQSKSGIFPDWYSQVTNDDSQLNWKFVGKIQLGVLEALSILINDHYVDFTDDLQVKKVFVDILKIIDNELIVEWKDILERSANNQELHNELSDIHELLSSLYKKIRKNYIKKCYRPLDVFPKNQPKTGERTFGDLTITDLPRDFRETEQFVERLDWFINDLFSAVSISDWISVFQLIEIQTGKSLTSLFKFRSPTAASDDEIEILNVFTWIRSLYGETPDDKILDQFPPPVKILFDVHYNLEKYFKLQIADPSITRDVRTSRMIAILQILSVSRLRMGSVDLFNSFEKVEENDLGKISPHVPSFIETAITQAIVSPESRAFSRSWIYSASTLNSNVDSWDDLTQLLPNFDVEDLDNNLKGGLTPCVGWFIERLMEISCFVPNMSIENSKLINFDKRRFTYNCITNIVDMNANFSSAFSDSPEEIEGIKKDFQFLYQLAHFPVIEYKQLKEFASKENKEYPKNDQKFKFLESLIENEQEKLRRDAKKKDVLENQERDIKRSQLLSQARTSVSSSRESQPITDQNSLRKARQPSSPSKAPSSSMGKRLGGLLKSVRPFSINVGSTWSGPDRVVHPDDLPDVNNVDFSGKHAKPYQQIKLFNNKPLFVHSNIEGFFKIVGDGGEDYCFQALSNQDAQGWINALNVSKRYTYLSKDAQGLTTSKVFGVPIADVCEREGTLIPRIVERLLQEIELRGLDETGLYRIPGSVGSINLLKQAFDEGNDFTLEDDRWFEINTLAGCFKSYLRELPENLLTSELLPEFVYATKQGDLTDNLKILVRQLPIHNYHLLKRLFEHLNRVIQHSENNRMDATNLAIVFAMSFINNDNIGASMGTDLGALQTILQSLIKNPDAVFGEQFNDDSTVFTGNE
ncbi:GTPase-activating protein [Wickerhamomyces ciferrii]|uniref:GTPase-activating protein n=1 Tax=Wickerhamomyces ciferrii (strain ATCC 14091 / BCRC 22168 / CBS 111 / JCM 3599 / NBRC 0793 / NRRL Y-1031 F-60-10) TaxID=1206466 RepID=K0KF15_WICCF|nr:GTPase-activating protein [Wickerhamomyces ciferrii]CCH41556.1 GTPase-activating protein [Wickerhamomyces ciferrii]